MSRMGLEPENILEARGISFTYPDGTRALEKLSVAIRAGAKVAVLGANGSGKTTLFLCFNGTLRPQEGEIFFCGSPLSYDRKSLKELRKKVGIVFQDPDIQLFSPTVKQEVAFGPLNLGLGKEEVLARVHKALQAAGIAELEDKATHLLSYGQKKRVSIADILAMEPQVMISDEPTAWLDQEHAAKIMRLFEEINCRGTTVIISTHDVELAYSWADEVVLLQDGRSLASGKPAEVFLQEGLLQKAGMKKPPLLEMFLYLQEKGLIAKDTPFPRRWEDLKGILDIKIN